MTSRSRMRRVPAQFEKAYEEFRRRVSKTEGFEPSFSQFLVRTLRTNKDDDIIFKNTRL